VEITAAVPGISRGVMTTRSPVFKSTGVCCFSRPVRILGPCRSCRMQTVRPASLATLRSRLITCACSSCVPSEQLSRATSRPSRIRSRSAASDELAGPSVQTIFALRKCTVDFAFEPPGWVIQYLYLFLGESVVGSLGVGLGVYFSAQQNDRG